MPTGSDKLPDLPTGTIHISKYSVYAGMFLIWIRSGFSTYLTIPQYTLDRESEPTTAAKHPAQG